MEWNGGMNNKHADIDDLLATFSAHIKENYPPPEQFKKNLENLLASKKEKFSGDGYTASLERNIIFLHNVVIEIEAFLEIALEGVLEEEHEREKIDEMLAGIEQNAREATLEGDSAGPEGLFKLRGSEGYVEKLEFNYFLLMTLRMLLVEFFNVYIAVKSEYVIDRIDEAAPQHVTSHVEMTANYFLGNISVGEIVEGGSKNSQPSS